MSYTTANQFANMLSHRAKDAEAIGRRIRAELQNERIATMVERAAQELEIAAQFLREPRE